MTATIPTVHFDTHDLPAEERFGTWRSAVHAHEAWLPEGADSSQFAAMVEAWTLGDVVLAVSRLLADFLLSLVRQLPEMSTEDASGLSKSLVHLLAACLKATSDAAAPAIGRQAANVRHLAETYIENNLSSKDLDPAAMCKALGIS